MNDKLARRFGIGPGLLAEIDRVSSMTKEYDRLLGGLKGLEPAFSTAKQFEQVHKQMGFIDALPAFAKTQPLSELLETLGGGAKARDLVMGASLGAISLGLEQSAEYGSLRKQFETIAGATSTMDSLRQATLSAGILMDSSAAALVHGLGALAEDGHFSSMFRNVREFESLASAVDDTWGVPLWRPSFERLANVSLARDIGAWRRKTPESRSAEPAAQALVALRAEQAQDDGVKLDGLVVEIFPSLELPIAGARIALRSRHVDYSTHFAASARKAIDLVLRRAAPLTKVSEWVQADPSRPRRQKGGRGNVTFRERVEYIFRGATDGARTFFVTNINEIVILRDELCSLDHGPDSDPHPRLVENRQLWERLLLHLLREGRRAGVL